MSLAEEPEAAAALKVAGIERFVLASAGLYQEARRLVSGTR